MTGRPEVSGAVRIGLIVITATLAVIMLCTCGLALLMASAGTMAGTAVSGQAGRGLRPDAPIPPEYLAWVLHAGAICPEIGPAELAAQIDLESGWNPNAVAHNPASRGGDAMGIAQFQVAAWTAWGADADGDGQNSPYDPEDAIMAMGRLMCDNVAWAQHQLAADQLCGDVLDLAWAAYFAGRGAILAAGGVPASGATHDYPQQVRARLTRYAAVPVGPGGWTLPLRPGAYTVGSGFGQRWGRLHAGVDFIASTGTPIHAAAAGLVIDAGCSSAYCDRPGNPELSGCGYRININHGGGVVTRYCHAVRLGVTAGQQVAAGQVIAWVGSTGHSSGPHLHFETHVGSAPPATNANAVDPIPFLRGVGLNP
ncbi:MAG: peptidoglycan DD-metalloendopeptidase family protein [Dactylosporangium sp.]|nr:peptidoglycan DD-metalloendopeptidase family protein [Dactylosporangium sp.]NNJ62250.1 peptidoglycan DD-metalloendopeptidase family protein [Dactylosporangium sp.]